MKFKEWFEKNLIVGAFPYKQNAHFDTEGIDIVINVSDEWYPDVEMQLKEKFIATYWFPMNECKKDIGLNSIYGAMVILNRAEQRNLRVYLHCHAGINRSQTVRCAYYFMRTGQHFEIDRGNGFINPLLASCGRGYLPPKAEMEQYLINIMKHLSFMQGGILDDCKLGTINNF